MNNSSHWLQHSFIKERGTMLVQCPKHLVIMMNLSVKGSSWSSANLWWNGRNSGNGRPWVALHGSVPSRGCPQWILTLLSGRSWRQIRYGWRIHRNHRFWWLRKQLTKLKLTPIKGKVSSALETPSQAVSEALESNQLMGVWLLSSSIP
jgi:hypothetical protein